MADCLQQVFGLAKVRLPVPLSSKANSQISQSGAAANLQNRFCCTYPLYRKPLCAVAQEAASTEQSSNEEVNPSNGSASVSPDHSGESNPHLGSDPPRPSQQNSQNKVNMDVFQAWLEYEAKNSDKERRSWAQKTLKSKSETDEVRQELKGFMAEIMAMVDKEDTAGAASLADANLRALTEQLNDDVAGVEQALMLDTLAHVYYLLTGNHEIAPILDLASNVFESLQNDDELILVFDSLHHVGQLFARVDRNDDALRFFNAHVQLLLRVQAPTLFILPGIFSLSAMFEVMGQKEEAMALHVFFLKRVETEPRDLFVLGRLLFNFAILLSSEKESSGNAESAFLEAADCFRECVGLNSLELALVNQRLAALYVTIDRPSEAEPVLQAAINSLASKKSQTAVQSYLESLALMAQVKLALKRQREALTVFQTQVKETERILGSFHPMLLLPLNKMADIHYQGEEYRAAIPFLVRIISILKATEAYKTTDITDPHFRLADCYLHSHELEEAEKVAVQALNLAEKFYGDRSHHSTATSCLLVSDVMRVQERWVQAEGYLSRSIHMFESLYGPTNPVLIAPIENLAIVLEELGKESLASDLRSRSAEIRRLVLSSGEESEV